MVDSTHLSKPKQRTKHHLLIRCSCRYVSMCACVFVCARAHFGCGRRFHVQHEDFSIDFLRLRKKMRNSVFNLIEFSFNHYFYYHNFRSFLTLQRNLILMQKVEISQIFGYYKSWDIFLLSSSIRHSYIAYFSLSEYK